MKILIKNVHVISMDSGIAGYDEGCIAVDGDVIAYIGREEQFQQDFAADRVIDGKGMLALPGFINAHTHSAMSIFRGYANDIPLMEWLRTRIWPMEDRLMPEDAYWLSLLAIAEMIMSGVTAFADMYMFMDQTAKAAAQSGIRAVLARGLQGPDPKAEQRLAENRRLWEEWNGEAEGRIRVMVGPHAVYTCSREYLEKCINLARELGAGIHIHLAETRDEVEECRRRYGRTPVEYLEEAGLFKHHTIAVHCVHLTPGDMDILRNNNVHVVHCPVSNLKLGSGIAQAAALVDKGINVALGTDSASSNNCLSIMKEMNFAALLSKGINENPTLLPARQAFEMATINGAKALGWEDEIGCLDVGRKADIILLRQDGPHYHPAADLITHLVYSGRDSDVDTVIVNGNILMEDRKLTTIDLEQVCHKVEEIRTRIMGRI